MLAIKGFSAATMEVGRKRIDIWLERDGSEFRCARCGQDGYAETLSYYSFPEEHWVRIRTNNGLERIMKEIRRRTRVVGSFPDGQSALMLAAARLRHIA
ncbi:MAG: transposase, partial [Planctomycetota bacterium]